MISRRGFLAKGTAGAVAAHAALRNGAWAQPVGANDAVRVAVVGLNGKGAHHLQMLRAIPGVRVVALCDADRAVLEKRAAELAADNLQVATYVDVRKLLESKDVDAITIATPNHWHALMGIWACQAGKDVYVEKPVSHNVWEGRRLVEAAAKYGRVVAAGTQSRSDEALLELAADIRAGKLGKILRARGFCYKRRESIGRVDGPQPIPPSVDYDLFCGPAPLEPLRRKQLHYDWHWFWATGNGDIGNQGVHEMDVCRWMLGEEKLPPRVFSIGGRFGYVDDAETPNTQVAVLDYPSAPILFEVRGLPRRAGAGYEDHYRGVRIGYVIEGEDATFVGASGGGWIHDRDGQEGAAALGRRRRAAHGELDPRRAQPPAAGPQGPGRGRAPLLGAVPPREHLPPPGNRPGARGRQGRARPARRRGGDAGPLRLPPRRQRRRPRSREGRARAGARGPARRGALREPVRVRRRLLRQPAGARPVPPAVRGARGRLAPAQGCFAGSLGLCVSSQRRPSRSRKKSIHT